ncbi:MAG: hypothetical protein BGO69_19610 [Bacteroidetes bacterium 46-16]|nr:MAG: hypothetical protein BGO69_19610 [Bacteroidetes bacterium 46-16]
MKKINIIYWTFTGIFAALMLFSALPDVLNTADAVKFMTALGYPAYFTPFIGVAKILGCAALLLPVSPRLKEWAYAGLAFDLIGAIYSQLAAFPFSPAMLFMLAWIIPGIISYLFFHKRIKAGQANRFSSISAAL